MCRNRVKDEVHDKLLQRGMEEEEGEEEWGGGER
jgi:hypothetical protein